MYNLLKPLLGGLRNIMKHWIDNKRVLMVVVISIAFQIFLAGMLQTNIDLRNLFVIIGIALFIFGIFLYVELERDINKMKDKEDKEQQKRATDMQILINELRGLRKDLSKLKDTADKDNTTKNK